MLKALREFEDQLAKAGGIKKNVNKSAIARKYGIPPSTFDTHVEQRILGHEHKSGGARKPKVLTISKFSRLQYRLLYTVNFNVSTEKLLNR